MLALFVGHSGCSSQPVTRLREKNTLSKSFNWGKKVFFKWFQCITAFVSHERYPWRCSRQTQLCTILQVHQKGNLVIKTGTKTHSDSQSIMYVCTRFCHT